MRYVKSTVAAVLLTLVGGAVTVLSGFESGSVLLFQYVDRFAGVSWVDYFGRRWYVVLGFMMLFMVAWSVVNRDGYSKFDID